MNNFLLVAFGGALGSMLRYGVALGLNTQFPYATLFANVIGSLIIGALFYFLQTQTLNEKLLLFLMIGFCGGFTTFSSFSLENLKLLNDGQILQFIVYTFGSIVLSLVAVYLGYYLAKLT